MIFKVAWRNIWRNKLRSFTVLTAIALGLWAGILATSFANGINKSRVNSIIEKQISHIQIHNKQFGENFEINKNIKNIAEVDNALKNENVKSFAKRVIVNGLISSASSSSNIQVKGINAEEENQVIDLKSCIVEGDFFEKKSRSPIIVIGEKLAKKLTVKVRKKVVVRFQDKENNVVAVAFKVGGIFKTFDTRSDETLAYVQIEKLQELTGIGNAVHEVAILLKDDNKLDMVDEDLGKILSNLKVESWKEIFPGLNAANEISFVANMLVLILIILALSFGIVNTMLMAVLERVKEFGMLMAVGMNKTKVFFMVMFETIFLMCTALPFGMFLAFISVAYFSKNGIDFSAYGDGLENMGIDTILYPSLDATYYPIIITMVISSAILSSLYPAIKATRLNPAEAISKI